MAKLLIVEDERSVSELLRLRLTASGHKITLADNGEEGWEKVQSQKPDLVILDIGIPLLNGIDLCRLIKNSEQLKKTPIIMLTSRKTLGDWEKGLDAGADAYLNKPYNMNELIENIEKLL
ncbi:MAG: response regulator [Elusimicrobia bacterium]|nr:response regulator [Candidatus Liberimonas magnetica]